MSDDPIPERFCELCYHEKCTSMMCSRPDCPHKGYRKRDMTDNPIKKTAKEIESHVLHKGFKPECWKEYIPIIREAVRAVLDDIENRAEENMIKTHKLEGMHYAALRDVRKELGIERKCFVENGEDNYE